MAALTPLLIAGTGGFGREALEAVRACNRVEPAWEVLGWLDDDPALEGRSVDGHPVLGPVASVADHPDARLIIAIGNPGNFTHRHRIVGQLGLPDERYATVVHPAAVLAGGTAVGPGSVILATTVATTAMRIGAHVTVMPGVILTHDDVVGDFATLGSGARLAGSVRIGTGAYVGAAAMVREGLAIGDWALVGMGAGVTCDVPPGEVWAGLPARYLRPVAVLPAP